MDKSHRYRKTDRDENTPGRSAEIHFFQGYHTPELSIPLLFQEEANINEYDLNRGVTALCAKDPAASVRVRQDALTLRDVEYIIEKATFGIIKLELFDYDY